MTFEISIKKYKIHNLQIEYKDISKTIFNIQTHIESLNNELFIDTTQKNLYLNKDNSFPLSCCCQGRI